MARRLHIWVRTLGLTPANFMQALNTIQLPPNLEKLTFYALPALRALPSGVCQLPELQSLEMSECQFLEALPKEVSRLAKLRSLRAHNCESLTVIPKGISRLSALKVLDLEGCTALAALPRGLLQLPLLWLLDLSLCQHLDVDSSWRLLTQLTGLKSLILKDCFWVTEVPSSIGRLNRLEDFNLAGTKLQRLPASMSMLTALQSLDVSQCPYLTAVPLSNLRALEDLSLSECSSLAALPEALGDLTALTRLHMFFTAVKALPSSFGMLTGLRSLELGSNYALAALPASFCRLTGLRELSLDLCHNLGSVACLGQLSSLQRIRMHGCVSVESLPHDLGQLASLTRLDLSRCLQLRALPDSMGDLSSLRKLSIAGCHKLEQLPDSLCRLGALTLFDMRGLAMAVPDWAVSRAQLEVLSGEVCHTITMHVLLLGSTIQS